MPDVSGMRVRASTIMSNTGRQVFAPCVQVCSACTELKGPATEYVRYFNFAPEVKASIKSPPLSVLLAYRQQCIAGATKEVSLLSRAYGQWRSQSWTGVSPDLARVMGDWCSMICLWSVAA